ncbi:hypothetical protein ACFPXP_02725 [Marinicrinis lubricantis]|uniref:Uncharacterized protein n=1 Tax=Marinicrinis lubricantis TaxID=2086470 RepID=A0ABW1IK62_9BACL
MKLLSVILSLAFVCTIVNPSSTMAENRVSDVISQEAESIYDKSGEEIGTRYRTIEREIDGNKIILKSKTIEKLYDGRENEKIRETEFIKTEDEIIIDGVKYNPDDVIIDLKNHQNGMQQSSINNVAQRQLAAGYTILSEKGYSTYINYSHRKYNVPGSVIPGGATWYVTKMYVANGTAGVSSALLLDPNNHANQTVTIFQHTNGQYASVIDDFEDYTNIVIEARDDLELLSVELSGLIGFGAITAATVWALIGTVGGAGIIAAQMYEAYADARDALKDAYNLIKNIPSVNVPG